MNNEEIWLLNEKYGGEKTEVLELLNDFIAFQNRTKFKKKLPKMNELNTHSVSEDELIFAEFCAVTMQNETKKIIMETHGEIVKQFHAACARLKAGEPLAYLIGTIPFLNTTIYLDSHPLVPRPETEYWVNKVITECFEPSKPTKVLDLCAGSGCIGIAVLQAIPLSHVDFVELDKEHHSTIAKNIIANGIDLTRTHIFGGNLFENITEKYDFIFSNPPYIDKALNRTTDSVISYEPHLALFGGENGLDIISEIIMNAPCFLKEGGTLVIEHEPEQTGEIKNIAQHVQLGTETCKDQFGVLRFTYLTRL